MANFVLFCAAVIAILCATILNRTPGNYELILTPFAALSAARQQPELYREMLMNVFLFFPLGLTLSNALPRKCTAGAKSPSQRSSAARSARESSTPSTAARWGLRRRTT